MPALYKNLFLLILVVVMTIPGFCQDEQEIPTVSDEAFEADIEVTDNASEPDDSHAAVSWQPVQPKKISAEQYKRATHGLDYSDERKAFEWPKAKEQKDFKFDWNFDFSNLSQILIIALILIVMIVAAYYVWKNPTDKRIQGEYDISMESLEERLHETDLMRYLAEALAQKDYAVAVRLYQLQTWKDLAAAGRIKWSKEKTNRSYLNELFNHPLYAQIRKNTRTYETVWFGNTTLTEQQFRAIEPDFRAVLQQTGTSLNVNA